MSLDRVRFPFPFMTTLIAFASMCCNQKKKVSAFYDRACPHILTMFLISIITERVRALLIFSFMQIIVLFHSTSEASSVTPPDLPTNLLSRTLYFIAFNFLL